MNRRIAVLIAALVACPVATRAQTSKAAVSAADRAEARKHVAKGKVFLATKKIELALAEFEAAHAIDPQPASFKGLADCYAALGRTADAYEMYDRAFVEPGEPLLPHERKQVEKAMADLEKVTGTIKIVVDIADAVVELDGAKVGKSPLPKPIRVEAGKHTVKVKKPGHVSYASAIDVAGGTAATVQATLPPESTVGTVVVRESTGKPAQVFVDGVLVGDAPLELSAAPGKYDITLVVEGTAGAPRSVEPKVGEKIDLVLDAPTPPPKPAVVVTPDGSCEHDDDCDDGERCSKGVCKKRKKRKQESAEAGAGESCVTKPCGPGLECSEDLCRLPDEIPTVLRGSIGAEWRGAPGIGGVGKFPAPLHTLGGHLELPFSRSVRGHFRLSYANLNAHSGFALTPFGLGFPFVVWNEGKNSAWIEPGVDFLEVLAVFDDKGHDVTFGSAGWLRGSLHFGSFYLGVEPVGFSASIARLTGNSNLTRFIQETSIAYVARIGLGGHF